MAVFLVTVLIIMLICFLMFLTKRKKTFEVDSYNDQYNYKKIYIFLFMAVVIVVEGFRKTYADTDNYRMAYGAIPDSFFELIEHSKHIGFDIVQWLLRFISKDRQFICIAMAIIFTVIDVWFIKKQAYDFPVSLYLYFLYSFASNMNGLRQSFAAVLLMFAFPWACRKRYFRYIAWVLLLSTIHRSILVVIPLMFLFSGRRWNNGLIVFVVFCLFSAVVPGPMNFLIGALVSDDYSHYIYTYTAQANILHVFVEAVPLVMGIVYHMNRKKRMEESRVVDVLINMQAISFSFMVLATRMAQYARIGMYMRNVNALLIPMLIPQIFREKNVNFVRVAAIILYFAEFMAEQLLYLNTGSFSLDFSFFG